MSFTHDLYISYEEDIVKELRIFHQKLASPPYSYAIWRNETSLDKSNQQNLADQICDAIKSSKIFLCFLTRRYAESDEHKGEINYARTLKKTIIMLKIENLRIEEVGGIGLILANSPCIECFKHPGEWYDPSLWKNEPNSIYEIATHINNNIQVIKTL